MLIGAGKCRDGLYYFHGTQVVKACSAKGVNQLELWHRRLGHPSFKVTRSLLDLVSCMLTNFFALVKRQFDKHIKVFRSNNGT
uniref:GAG-pre-integrase domain-containing protein n=1 Tax=Cajanus cajan TaxID=3821 RepID=A0A151RWN4_CAJCA|nr:hypothetical protein KK1_031445 [Cajanus cajan]